jgi:hypothetical protein
VPHKDNERFRRVDLGDQSGFSTEKLSHREIKVTGICPRCDDTMTISIRRGMVGGGTVKGPADSDPGSTGTAPATIYCECGYYHEGREEGSSENGCGAYWTIAL